MWRLSQGLLGGRNRRRRLHRRWRASSRAPQRPACRRAPAHAAHAPGVRGSARGGRRLGDVALFPSLRVPSAVGYSPYLAGEGAKPSVRPLFGAARAAVGRRVSCLMWGQGSDLLTFWVERAPRWVEGCWAGLRCSVGSSCLPKMGKVKLARTRGTALWHSSEGERLGASERAAGLRAARCCPWRG